MAYTFKHGDRPIDGYTIQRGVGRGGFGEVYYAISDGGREVALKYLRDNPQIELRGVSHTINLKSPHLVQIFDVKKSVEGEYFIVMEYVAGPSLRDLLVAEPNGLGPQKAAYFVREIAKGLAYLHDRGIVHRDMKPGNIFYEDGYVKIGDYGLSKFISVSRHSLQTSSVGTVHYMAPEVGSGNYSRGIDIYALGVILYEMLLGKVPFEGASMGEVLMKHLTEQPEVDALPHPFGHIIRKSLAKDPKDRFQTVDEMVEELFGVDDVKNSLVGFSPKSLSGAVRRGAADIGASPVPSPNPIRPETPVGLPGRGQSPPPVPADFHDDPLGQRLGKRMARIGKKFDKKLKKVGGPPLKDDDSGRAGQFAGRPPEASPAAISTEPDVQAPVKVAPGEIARRLFLAAMITVMAAIGVGLIVEANRSRGDDSVFAGIGTFLMTCGILLGVVGSRWIMSGRLAAGSSPWAGRFITAVCCLPLMFVGVIPMLAEGLEEEGLTILAGVFMLTLFCRWDKRLEAGARGNIEVGPSIVFGLIGLALAAPTEEFCIMAAGVMAASTFNIQLLGAAFPSLAPVPLTGEPRQRRRRGRMTNEPRVSQGRDVEDGRFFFEAEFGIGRPQTPAAQPVGVKAASSAIPAAIPLGRPVRGAKRASIEPLPPLRSWFARVFFSIIAFCLFCGTVITFVSLFVVDFWQETYEGGFDHESFFGTLVGCIACFSMFIFAARKTTWRKRVGFFQETLRPFLTSAALIALGASISALAVGGMIIRDEERVLAIVGIVFGSLLFLVMLFSWRRRPHTQYIVADTIPQAEPMPSGNAGHGEAYGTTSEFDSGHGLPAGHFGQEPDIR